MELFLAVGWLSGGRGKLRICPPGGGSNGLAEGKRHECLEKSPVMTDRSCQEAWPGLNGSSPPLS